MMHVACAQTKLKIFIGMLEKSEKSVYNYVYL